ncbi:MAG: MOSC domain-containing protein [Nocardioidaceae bacterium]
MPPRVLSVNIAQPVDAEWAGNLKRTAIQKRHFADPVRVEPLGIEGDQVADTKNHGGIHQAVYAFAREDLDWWAEQLDGPINDGQFGENLTTEGIDVNEARIGERWQIGTVELEVAQVRIPCSVFKGWMGVSGYDDTAWVKRFTAEGRPGPYLRVVQPGTLTAGDELIVVHRPDHEVTVSMMFRALTTERELLPRLLEVGETLAPWPLATAERYLART